MSEEKTVEYTPCGDEWEKELMKCNKRQLISMLRKQITGTEDKKLMQIETAIQAQIQVEGIINDFESRIIDKDKCLELLGEYTGRIMELFWNNAKKKTA